MHDTFIKRFESPDEVRTFEKGKLELVRMGNLTIGRATYEPGWKWSQHVGAALGQKSCQVAHVGMVVSGNHKVLMDDGTEIDLHPGDLFSIGPGHDAWVVGNDLYVSLHFLGADHSAK